MACLKTLVPLYALDEAGRARAQMMVAAAANGARSGAASGGASGGVEGGSGWAAEAHYCMRPNWSLVMEMLSTHAATAGSIPPRCSSSPPSSASEQADAARCLMDGLRLCCELSAVWPADSKGECAMQVWRWQLKLPTERQGPTRSVMQLRLPPFANWMKTQAAGSSSAVQGTAAGALPHFTACTHLIADDTRTLSLRFLTASCLARCHLAPSAALVIGQIGSKIRSLADALHKKGAAASGSAAATDKVWARAASLLMCAYLSNGPSAASHARGVDATVAQTNKLKQLREATIPLCGSIDFKDSCGEAQHVVIEATALLANLVQESGGAMSALCERVDEWMGLLEPEAESQLRVGATSGSWAAVTAGGSAGGGARVGADGSGGGCGVASTSPEMSRGALLSRLIAHADGLLKRLTELPARMKDDAGEQALLGPNAARLLAGNTSGKMALSVAELLEVAFRSATEPQQKLQEYLRNVETDEASDTAAPLRRNASCTHSRCRSSRPNLHRPPSLSLTPLIYRRCLSGWHPPRRW